MDCLRKAWIHGLRMTVTSRRTRPRPGKYAVIFYFFEKKTCDKSLYKGRTMHTKNIGVGTEGKVIVTQVTIRSKSYSLRSADSL